MNCKGVQPLLSAYLDRELDGNEMLDIRAHLAECEECRLEAEALKSLKRFLGGVETPEVPEGLEERLVANVLRSKPEPVREPARRWRGAFVFAGVAACSMFATMLILNNVPKHEPAAKAASSTDLAFDVQLDQFSAGSDAFGGVPVVTAAAYGNR